MSIPLKNLNLASEMRTIVDHHWGKELNKDALILIEKVNALEVMIPEILTKIKKRANGGFYNCEIDIPEESLLSEKFYLYKRLTEDLGFNWRMERPRVLKIDWMLPEAPKTIVVEPNALLIDPFETIVKPEDKTKKECKSKYNCQDLN